MRKWPFYYTKKFRVWLLWVSVLVIVIIVLLLTFKKRISRHVFHTIVEVSSLSQYSVEAQNLKWSLISNKFSVDEVRIIPNYEKIRENTLEYNKNNEIYVEGSIFNLKIEGLLWWKFLFSNAIVIKDIKCESANVKINYHNLRDTGRIKDRKIKDIPDVNIRYISLKQIDISFFNTSLNDTIHFIKGRSSLDARNIDVSNYLLRKTEHNKKFYEHFDFKLLNPVVSIDNNTFLVKASSLGLNSLDNKFSVNDLELDYKPLFDSLSIQQFEINEIQFDSLFIKRKIVADSLRVINTSIKSKLDFETNDSSSFDINSLFKDDINISFLEVINSRFEFKDKGQLLEGVLSTRFERSSVTDTNTNIGLFKLYKPTKLKISDFNYHDSAVTVKLDSVHSLQQISYLAYNNISIHKKDFDFNVPLAFVYSNSMDSIYKGEFRSIILSQPKLTILSVPQKKGNVSSSKGWFYTDTLKIIDGDLVLKNKNDQFHFGNIDLLQERLSDFNPNVKDIISNLSMLQIGKMGFSDNDKLNVEANNIALNENSTISFGSFDLDTPLFFNSDTSKYKLNVSLKDFRLGTNVFDKFKSLDDVIFLDKVLLNKPDIIITENNFPLVRKKRTKVQRKWKINVNLFALNNARFSLSSRSLPNIKVSKLNLKVRDVFFNKNHKDLLIKLKNEKEIYAFASGIDTIEFKIGNRKIFVGDIKLSSKDFEFSLNDIAFKGELNDDSTERYDVNFESLSFLGFNIKELINKQTLKFDTIVARGINDFRLSLNTKEGLTSFDSKFHLFSSHFKVKLSHLNSLSVLYKLPLHLTLFDVNVNSQEFKLNMHKALLSNKSKTIHLYDLTYLHGHNDFEGIDFKASIGNISIDGFKDLKNWDSSISFNSIYISDPHIHIYRQEKKEESKSSTSIKRRPNINVDYLNVNGGNVNLYSKSNDSIEFNIPVISAEGKSIRLDSDKALLSSLLKQDISFYVDDLDIPYINQDFYNLNLSGIKGNLRSKTIDITQLQLTPKYPQYEFSRRYGKQTDRIVIPYGSIHLGGVSVERLVNYGAFICDTISLSGFELRMLRDKRVPFPKDQRRDLLVTMLRKLKTPIHISHLFAFQNRFIYSERVKNSNEPGSVFFTNLGLRAENICNIPEVISDTMVMRAFVDGYVMGAGKMDVEFHFPLHFPKDTFWFKANVAPMDFTLLNNMTKNTFGVGVKRGVGGLKNAMVYANNDYSIGSEFFKYKNFKIYLYNKEKGKKRGFFGGVTSFFANSIFLKSNNPRKNRVRIGEVSYVRNKQKSIINYIWHSVLSGLTYTLGFKTNQDVIDELKKKRED
ncbi:MAG: hypothetical protein ACEPOV_08365 [Hyphomicrobiales bacterium]